MFVSKTTGSQNLNLVRDPFFNNTVLLLHGDGTKGANNSVFLDGTPSNNAITKIGTSTQGTFSPFSTTGWSNQFNGTTAYLTVATNTEFNIGSNDFTVEGWIYPTSVASTALVIERRVSGGFVAGDWGLYILSSNLVFFAHNYDATGNAVLTSGAIIANVWTHFALVRRGTITSLYINGVSAASTTAVNISTNTSAITIGADIGSGTRWFFPGYISNLRFVRGTAVYTGNFSPPTSQLTAITGTELLTCQSNNFRDNSINSQNPTPVGTPSVQSFSPLAPTRIYSKSMFGGSVFFNGTSDSLDVPASNNFYFGQGIGSNFSIEGWVYPIGPLTSNQVIISTLSTNQGSYTEGQFEVSINAGALTIRYGQTANTTLLGGIGGGIVTANVWNYFSYTKSVSGATGTIANRLNGSDITSGSSAAIGSNIFGSNTVGPTIGYRKNSNTSMTYFKGYISDLEIRKYVGSYTPSVPTLPKTPVANTQSNGGGTTQFLLNGTNAGIIDSTQKNNLITVGAAQLSSTVSKFGETSMFFNGTTDYLSIPTNDFFSMGTGNFTIEFWAYWNAVSGTIPGNVLHTVTSGTTGLSIYIISNRIALSRYNVADDLAAVSVETAGSWNHYAITRNNSIAYIFKNGVLLGSGSVTTNYVQSGLQIGLGAGSAVSGYIDELRVTTGVARYTSNFTPRTGRFPDR